MSAIEHPQETNANSLIPTSSDLHNRAGDSAKETRQSIVNLANGGLAVFFLALTAEVKPALTGAQKGVIAVALAAMAIAIFAGLWSGFADAQWSYYWAKNIESKQHPKKELKQLQEKQDWWHTNKRWSEQLAIVAFAIGVFVSVIYIALRAFIA